MVTVNVALFVVAEAPLRAPRKPIDHRAAAHKGCALQQELGQTRRGIVSSLVPPYLRGHKPSTCKLFQTTPEAIDVDP
jgi:hypothetical protein